MAVDRETSANHAGRSVEIRPAQAHDAEALSAIAFKAKAHWSYSAEALESWRRELAVSADEIASKSVFVALADGRIAGFYSFCPAERGWLLDHLWVLPEFMRRGIGRALVTHALETAARGGASSVTVDADPNAESFYLACGATRCGEVSAPISGQTGRVRPQLRFRTN